MAKGKVDRTELRGENKSLAIRIVLEKMPGAKGERSHRRRSKGIRPQGRAEHGLYGQDQEQHRIRRQTETIEKLTAQ